MQYYIIEPDVSFNIGDQSIIDYSVHPPKVDELHVEMVVWGGESIMTSFPCYVFEKKLADAIIAEKLSGIVFKDVVEISKNEQYLSDEELLPEVVWGQITGQDETADFFIAQQKDGRTYGLILSERAWTLIKGHNLGYALIKPYVSK